MKALLLSALLLAGLASCRASEVDCLLPTPNGGAWTLTSSTVVTTPLGGGAPVTQPKTVVPHTITLFFSTDGQVTLTYDKTITPSMTTTTTTGTYTLTNGVITTSYPGLGTGGRAYSETSTSLSDTALMLVSTEQTSTTTAIKTDTYTR